METYYIFLHERYTAIPEDNCVAPIFNVDGPIRHVEALDPTVQVVPAIVLAKPVLIVPKGKRAIRYPMDWM